MKPVEKIQYMAAIACDQELTATAVRVGIYLCNCLNGKTGQCNPAIEWIAYDTGCSKRSIQYAIDMLEKRGYLTIKKRGDGRSHKTKYVLKKDAAHCALSSQQRAQPIAPLLDNKGCNLETERVQIAAQKGANSRFAYNREGNSEGNSEETVKGKTGRKSKAKPPPEKWEIPPWVNKHAWAEFEQHRRDIKKPLKNLARTKAANLLRDMTHSEQQACIDNTIQNHWQGLFPDKVKRDTGKNQRGSGSERITEQQFLDNCVRFAKG